MKAPSDFWDLVFAGEEGRGGVYSINFIFDRKLYRYQFHVEDLYIFIVWQKFYLREFFVECLLYIFLQLFAYFKSAYML